MNLVKWKVMPVIDALPYLGPSNCDAAIVDVKGNEIAYVFEREHAELIVNALNDIPMDNGKRVKRRRKIWRTL